MVDRGTKRAPVRVVVVDDSALAREVLRELLDGDPEIEVVGVAQDGKEAVTMAEQLRPDLITMDLRMPGTDGLAAAAEIMRRVPTPVLLVTSSDFRRRQHDIFDSFRFGIVDVLEKPELSPDGVHSAAARILLEKVKILSRIRVSSSGREPRQRPAVEPGAPRIGAHRSRAIGIGASTGGPRALPEVLGHLPYGLPVPVLVAQHMSGPFVPAFAEWLAAESALPVAVAQDGMIPRPGQVLVAPGGLNMVLDRTGTVRLNSAVAPAGIRPSVDLLLGSLASVYGAGAVGVVLTGIGKDGTEGLRMIKRVGGVTLVQDAASCVVAGMPTSALAEGVVDAVVELHAMGPTLRRLVCEGEGPARLGEQ
jgi:two-component system, chemotaxis family, protein-glutamate methylesterase/glutaminase